MSYIFICENGHISHSASKDQRDPSCPQCRERTQLVENLMEEKGRIKPDHALSPQELVAVAKKIEAKGYSETSIAHILRLEVSELRVLKVRSEQLVTPAEITPEMTIWYPGPDYKGREGVYAKTVGEIPDKQTVLLVQRRAREDGEWAIENNRVGDRPEFMRKMMAWVSDPTNITQCLERIYKEENAHICTVDWVCRELANVTKGIGRGEARD